MTDSRINFEERRKHRRCCVDLGSFAVFSSDDSVLPGLIVDISLGGLAFYYFEGENWPVDSQETYNLFGYEFSVENVPLRTVSDFDVADENNPVYAVLSEKFHGKRKIRRRGARYGELTEEQKLKLEIFINEFNLAKEQQEAQK